MPSTDRYRLYHELAGWWPLISPPDRYAAEASYLRDIIAAQPDPARSVLDLGCGGGHVASHLRRWFTLTLVDISPQMLAASQRLNPECLHIQGDMRTIRLGQAFDAVLVHDAVDYITTTSDLRQVIATAFAHTRPGGVALFVPDHVKDAFAPGTAGGGGSDPTGARASFRVRTSDPDPADDWIAADYEFTLVEPGGAARVIRETHRLGAFATATWLSLLRTGGFADGFAAGQPAAPGSDGQPDHLFVGRRLPPQS